MPKRQRKNMMRMILKTAPICRGMGRTNNRSLDSMAPSIRDTKSGIGSRMCGKQRAYGPARRNETPAESGRYSLQSLRNLQQTRKCSMLGESIFFLGQQATRHYMLLLTLDFCHLLHYYLIME